MSKYDNTKLRVQIADKIREIVHMSAESSRVYDTSMMWAFVRAVHLQSD